ncbi:hypothetical protein [Stigmatella aurantiaca]|uniref:Conserved uncharacterized protein n=1 Tax=Stigmatella aurantiaca (strain DW4/3-1) TaxID=378806 RepID=Q09DN5_STIAD|nr:hypothetical protein [Stigmatella aurantiaca]ADO75280.1 conserved uncharacterized protein [Stigmatella aurantiaca DW4/3-1]EAU69928.1 hypothetical protein STIAU_5640 [Stigmatella aurantiaca DW4/3-1]
MLKNWKLRLGWTALGAALATVGCFDFDKTLDECKKNGTCGQGGILPDGGLPDGGRPCDFISNEDLPDDEGIDANCDGVDGIAALGLFVDPVAGTNGATGTPTDPLKTLSEAFQKMQSPENAGRSVLYLAQGTYAEANLELTRPISLYGQYGGKAGNWDRPFQSPSLVSGGTVALKVRDLQQDAGVVLERLHILAANAAGPSEASIALHVINSQGVRLHRTILEAGRGGAGDGGLPGNGGLNGVDGGGGSSPLNGSNAGEGGLAPRFECRSQDRSGGSGQNGGGYNGAGLTGEEGRPSTLGGDGGMLGTARLVSGTYDCRGEELNGLIGLTGAPGSPGGAGDGGSGLGELRNGLWVATHHGAAGIPGEAGAGGGGGGSGGGCQASAGKIAAAGAGSGAGGSGGCGGEAGQGGGAGGASIALVLEAADVQFSHVTLRTRGGGAGGAGGAGGDGGVGGFGGQGANGVLVSGTYGSSNTPYSSIGGNGAAGGHGGHGGPGGPGGGGGGGPSVGIWCGANATYSVLPSETLMTELANGGPGGASPGRQGTEGSKLLQVNCPNP